MLFTRGLCIATGALLVAALAGCEGTSIEPAGPRDAGVRPLYNEDVRPIVFRRCLGCHLNGGIAPFPLDGTDAVGNFDPALAYEQAVRVGGRMAVATRDRVMPPFLADDSGSCRHFEESMWLSDEEIDTIGRWFETGMGEGDPTTPLPDAVVVPSLDGTVAAITGGRFTPSPPAGVEDDYRCYVVDPPAAGGFVTGYQVLPGHFGIVHHVIVYEPATDADADAAVAADASETDGPGYTCYGGLSQTGGLAISGYPLALWAPGAGATNFPAGTGLELAPGRKLIIQVHYNVRDLAGVEDPGTTIELELAPTATPAFIRPIINAGFSLEPGLASVSDEHVESLAGVLPGAMNVYGVFPHMHELGRALRVEYREGGATSCVVDLPRWDFHWQRAYWYTTPLEIRPEGSVSIECTWDTRAATSTVTFGEGTADEMCLSYFYVSF